MAIITNRERAAEQAIRNFEQQRERLYRPDGAPFYSEEEHQERLDALTTELRKKIEGIVTEVEGEAARHEQEAHGLSYTDPTKGLSSADRGRLETSRLFVSEDCERLPLDELALRLKAVAASSDKVPKVLHLRYGSFRVRALSEQLDAAARERRPVPEGLASHLRELEEAVEVLEEQLADKDATRRREAAGKAARETRALGARLRRRLAEVDGTDESALERAQERIRASL